MASTFALLAACSDDAATSAAPAPASPEAGPGTTMGDAGTTTDAAPAPAPEPPGPDIFPYSVSRGGAVVKSPKIVPITFAGDPLVTPLETFTAQLSGSEYWTAISSEYGVGALTTQTPIRIAETPPATLTDAEVRAWLAQKLETDPRFGGQPQPDTVYAIHYPANVTISFHDSPSCETFGGYHDETIIKGVAVSYAVLPRCATFGELKGMDAVTYAASHEYLEWATDPFPETKPAYASIDPEHLAWSLAFSNELGDLCVTGAGENNVRPAELGGVAVQRTWSNKAARAGHHPCVPYPDKAPYFTAIPMLSDGVALQDPFTSKEIQTHGVQVGVGQSKTIKVRLYADGPMTEWTVQVIDLARYNGLDAEFEVTLDKDHGVSGDILNLTVKGLAPAQNGFGFVLVSRGADRINLWPALAFN